MRSDLATYVSYILLTEYILVSLFMSLLLCFFCFFFHFVGLKRWAEALIAARTGSAVQGVSLLMMLMFLAICGIIF